MIYDDKFAYSHHASDPVCGQLLNSFDLVRLHLFGSMDNRTDENTAPGNLPSFKAMQDLAIQDELVKSTLAKERLMQAEVDFKDADEWQKLLELVKQFIVIESFR